MKRKGEDPEAIEEAVIAHQKRHHDKLQSQSKQTVVNSRKNAMDAEVKAAEKHEAELVEKRKKSAAKAADEKERKEVESTDATLEQNQPDETSEDSPSEEIVDETSTVHESSTEAPATSNQEASEHPNKHTD